MTLSPATPAPQRRAEALWAIGSVTGADHRRTLRDGQDGVALLERGGVTAAVVTDGCGSGLQSEVGARIGARWLSALTHRAFTGARLSDVPRLVDAIADRLTGRLRALACSLSPAGGVEPLLVRDHLLFTFLTLVVTPELSAVFGVGDGLVWIDGRATLLEAPGDAPDYLAYRLIGRSVRTRLHFAGPSGAASALAIATDGLSPLAEERAALGELVTDPAYRRNPSLLRKRLVVLADAGTLRDDATLAVYRRGEVTS